MIKVLYNALHLTGQFSGVQYIVEQLMKEAFFSPVENIHFEAICPADYEPDISIPSSQKMTNIPVNTSTRWKRIGYEHLFMQNYFNKQNKHILHCPAYIQPWNWKGLSVITVHDIIALDYPEYCSFTNRLYFKLVLPRSILNASKIITMSYAVKNDILNKFNINPDKIEVIYPGIDDVFRIDSTVEKLNNVRHRYQLPEKFILYVGNIEPKKNIVRLIRSFNNLTRQIDIPHSLVIAGRFAWKYKDVLQETDKLINKRILLPGYIDRADLPTLYSLADLFIFPSLYEGFGIPPLESMACGTPVIVSNRGALPEIAGKCALIVDPFSIDSMTAAMKELLLNQTLKEQLIINGKRHVQQFRWNEAWSSTAKLYNSL